MVARRHLYRIAGALAVAIAPPFSSVAVAQASLPGPGSRVRVTAPDYGLRQAAGRVERLTADSMTIDPDGSRPEVTLPFQGMSRLEVSTGKRPGVGLARGAGTGFVIGSLAGIALGALQYYTCSKEECGLWFLLTVPAGAGVGLIVGGIVGATRPPDRWQEVPLTPRSGESGMTVPNHTARIGLSISF
ncbi:MAG TPA: hypothetical protein VJ650_13655 [Gemmatimonadaceae bacterium]|nr:hypothetical protein [Gemmatimonadaceae bacterium]